MSLAARLVVASNASIQGCQFVVLYLQGCQFVVLYWKEDRIRIFKEYSDSIIQIWCVLLTLYCPVLLIRATDQAVHNFLIYQTLKGLTNLLVTFYVGWFDIWYWNRYPKPLLLTILFEGTSSCLLMERNWKIRRKRYHPPIFLDIVLLRRK